jgi:alpha-glucosidase
VIDMPDTPQPPPRNEWWRGAVIYQIYPRSFADSNADGIGDLPGIHQHLDYVASLGVDGIWLSPFFKSPMRDFGYDVSNYCDVDPIFGTIADFDQIIARAHELNLKVIIDQVYAHTSTDHAWFAESRSSRSNPKEDWYVWADAKADGSPPTNWQAVFYGPCWTWDARRCQYYMHNFLPSQPNLNVHNPAVQEALLDTARFWLDRGVDGFRLDAINCAMHDPLLRDNPALPDGVGKRLRPYDFQQHLHNQSHPDIPKFLARVRHLTDSYGDRLTVAEVGGDRELEEMKLYTEGETHLNSAYGFHFLMAKSLTPDLVHRIIENWQGGNGEGWPTWAFSNHDAPRVASRWAAERDIEAVARCAMLIMLTLRGNVFLYQGEELGLAQGEIPFEQLQDPEAIENWPHGVGRDGARTPMPWTSAAVHGGFSSTTPWLPGHSGHLPLAVDRQEDNPASTLHLTRRLVELRRAHQALRRGSITIVEAPAGFLAFERAHGSERLLCVFNLGHATVMWPLPPQWAIIESIGGALATELPTLSGLVAAYTG